MIPASVTTIHEDAFNGVYNSHKVIMYGKEGSYAQTYALANSGLFTFVAK